MCLTDSDSPDSNNPNRRVSYLIAIAKQKLIKVELVLMTVLPNLKRTLDINISATSLFCTCFAPRNIGSKYPSSY